MIKRLILVLCLLLTPILVIGQDNVEETEDGVYLRLNSNFSVPRINGWEITAENETVLFSRPDIEAQIYVRIVDTLDTSLAIDAAIADVDAITLESTEPIVEGRIGRSNGTWNYRIFNDGDTNVTAYALLQSNQVYVVLFGEESADYDAFHLAKRSASTDPATPEDVINAVMPINGDVIAEVIGEDAPSQALSNNNPVEDNALWIESQYEDNLTTASYYYTPENIIYVTLVQGDVDIAPELSDAFDSIFLGFVITPDNSQYLLLGLAFSAVIMLALIGSMFLRYQNIKKDFKVLEQLEDAE